MATPVLSRILALSLNAHLPARVLPGGAKMTWLSAEEAIR